MAFGILAGAVVVYTLSLFLVHYLGKSGPRLPPLDLSQYHVDDTVVEVHIDDLKTVANRLSVDVQVWPKDSLIDVARLERDYYERKPDMASANERVAFGTSGHRGSSLDGTFTEAHILAITQAICAYRRAKGIDGHTIKFDERCSGNFQNAHLFQRRARRFWQTAKACASRTDIAATFAKAGSTVASNTRPPTLDSLTLLFRLSQ